MASLIDIRRRLRSVKNIQQITRAMKMVAGARIRRAELAMKAARPYATAIGEMNRELAASGGGTHPLLVERAPDKRAIVLMTADKGLCGAFNSNLVRAALQVAAQTTSPSALYLVVLKGRIQLRKTQHPVARGWPLTGKPFVELAAEIASAVTGDFLEGKIDQVTLVSSRFVSTIVQRPAPMQLLQIKRDPNAPAKSASKNSFEFEPDPAAVLAALLPKYVEFTIFQALLETQASEFAAKLLAMSNATDNAGKLIDELTLVMNKTRQAAITKEILEIVGGAEALKG